MLKKNKVVHFEIPVSDFQKAKEFYEKVFDWKIEMWGEDGAMVYTAEVDEDKDPITPGAINGGFYKRKAGGDQPNIVVETASIDETLKQVVSAGGKIETPKHPIGEWGFMADITDFEGNSLSLWENAA